MSNRTVLVNESSRNRYKALVLETTNLKKQKELHEKTHADTVVIVAVNPCLQTDKRKREAEDLFDNLLQNKLEMKGSKN